MKERTQLAILIAVLLVIGAAFAYITIIAVDFTFYKSELYFHDNIVEEKLYYKTNDAYHTLYRDFDTQINIDILTAKSNIKILDVKCSAGTPYYNDVRGYQHITGTYSGSELTYTKRNEYGCGFGNILGFEKNKEYTISARYKFYPDTLIKYDGKYYIKFLAYSGNRHPAIYNNIKISGEAIYPKFVASSSEFWIYVPYKSGDISKYNIITESQLNTNSVLPIILYLLMALIPSIVCFIVWRIYGKEYAEEDYPEELSQYPKERKAWEVSVYFHPPFGDLDQNFMPAMMLDFYNRKIIDIQVRKTGTIIKKEEVFIKILQSKIPLDDVETEFMKFLKSVESLDQNTDRYFSIKSISEQFFNKTLVLNHFTDLNKYIKEKSKEYIEYDGLWTLGVGIFCALAITVLFLVINIEVFSSLINLLQIYLVLLVTVIGFSIKKSSLFIRFKKDHYNEYQQWQGFRNYLSNLDSIPRTSYKGVIMWEKYLVYATCMGVGKEVLKELKKMNIVDQKYYNTMSAVYVNTAFGNGTSSGSGAGGGIGGGGIGGGGGGGR